MTLFFRIAGRTERSVAHFQGKSGSGGQAGTVADDAFLRIPDDGIAASEGGLMAVVLQSQLQLAQVFAAVYELLFRTKGAETVFQMAYLDATVPEDIEERLAEAPLEVVQTEGRLFEAVAGVLVAQMRAGEGEAVAFAFEMMPGAGEEALPQVV